MSKIKSYLQIENKFLGALLYFKDAQGRGCLKLSFKNQVADFVKGTDIPTTKLVPLPLKNPINLDISYKFQDSLLEVKRIEEGKIVQEFYKIPTPFTTCLFIIKMKDWHILDDAQNPENPLVLPYKNPNNSVAIVFSFLGDNGSPIAPKEYSTLMGVIDLPEANLNKFCIGIAEDKNNDRKENFVIAIPYKMI